MALLTNHASRVCLVNVFEPVSLYGIPFCTIFEIAAIDCNRRIEKNLKMFSCKLDIFLDCFVVSKAHIWRIYDRVAFCNCRIGKHDLFKRICKYTRQSPFRSSRSRSVRTTKIRASKKVSEIQSSLI